MTKEFLAHFVTDEKSCKAVLEILRQRQPTGEIELIVPDAVVKKILDERKNRGVFIEHLHYPVIPNTKVWGSASWARRTRIA